ncbi:unnamed protein product, partial [Polarella glacialis]
TLDLRRKAQIAYGRPSDHSGEVVVLRSRTFNIDKTIFGSLDQALPRIMAKDRLSIEIYWSDQVAARISEAFAKVPRAPNFDAPMLELDAELGSGRLHSLSHISFHRVIDNARLELSASDFWVDDTFLVVFRHTYDILVRAGKLEASVDLALSSNPPSSDLARPGMTLGSILQKVAPGSLKRKLGRQAIARFSNQIGHSLLYELAWQPNSSL